jgi:RimJ/RimL family protein N-acetyltransferase
VLRFVYGEDERVGKFVKEHIKRSVFGFDRCVTIGLEQDGELIAGVVYYDWHPAYGNLCVAIAGVGETWCTRRFLRCAYAYPFIQMNCTRITAVVAADNDQSLMFVKRLGFQFEGTMRNGFGNVDCLIFGQLRNEVKWL